MIEEKYIRALVEAHLRDTDKFLVELTVNEGNVIDVLVDGDENITINDCVNVSRAIEGQLNREENDFSLRVSSYGADQPMIHDRQIKKAVGKRIIIKKEDEKKMKGELVAFNGDTIVFAQIKAPAKKGGKEKRTENVELKLADLIELKREIMFK